MENVLRAVVKDTTLSEECVLLVINLVKLVLTTQPNVPHVLLTSSVKTEDVFPHVLKELILMPSQRPADHVILHAILAPQKSTV